MGCLGNHITCSRLPTLESQATEATCSTITLYLRYRDLHYTYTGHPVVVLLNLEPERLRLDMKQCEEEASRLMHKTKITQRLFISYGVGSLLLLLAYLT